MKINMTNTIKTETYMAEEGFYINIVENNIEKSYEAWIWNQNYGVKSLMFAVPQEQQTKKEFKELVWENFEENKKFYEEDVMMKIKKPKLKDARCYKLIPILSIKKTLQTYKQMKEFCKCQEKIKV